mmetsp:Transcript_18669/g.46222  ORF Transcript_18669/g.46222 Transcript_18669/m.46222 type:complete len:230 (-) Transcript_18669:1254-1943(-)
MPLLLADRRVELTVVRNHQHSTSPVVQRGGQGTQRFTIQKVCRFVHHNEMRNGPVRSSQHKLDLLSPTQTADFPVSTKLLSKTKAIQVLLNLGCCHWSQVQTSFLCSNLFICLFEKMLKSHSQKFDLRVVLVVFLRNMPFLDFVLDPTSTHTSTPNSFETEIFNCLLFFRRNLVGCRLQLLLVKTILETPLNVRNGTLLHVLFNVIKGVLGNISNTKILVDIVLALSHV